MFKFRKSDSFTHFFILHPFALALVLSDFGIMNDNAYAIQF